MITQNSLSLSFEQSIVKHEYPLDENIVTIDKSGNAVSYFKDLIWDFRYYNYRSNLQKKINFNISGLENCSPHISEMLIYEAKLMIYGLMYFETNARSTTICSVLTDWKSVSTLIQLAASCNMTVSDISNKNFLFSKIKQHFSYKNRKTLMVFITFIKKISFFSHMYKKHNFAFSNFQIYELNKLKNTLTDNPIKQHLVIPTRIYANLFNDCDLHLSNYLKNQSQLEALFCSTLFLIESGKKCSSSDYKKLIVDLNLEDFVFEYKLNSKRILWSYFCFIRSIALMNIAMFSGMRLSECTSLPIDTFRTLQLKNKKIYTLSGYTSKLTSVGPVTTVWITSKSVEKAINVAMSITRTICKIKNITSSDDKKFPLFLSFGNVKNNGLFDVGLMFKPNIIGAINFFKIDLQVTQSDYEELELTQIFNDLDVYGIHISSNFPLSLHQFRRSLTVYAARSHLVQTPALKSQLKHVSQDMTYYYANNSHLAKNYLLEIDLIDAFKEEKAIDELISFQEDVINNSSKLFGAEGTRLQLAKELSDSPLFLTDVKEAAKLMKEGRLFYHRTPLGGCSRKTTCDKISEISITACIHCADAIFSYKSLKALQKAKENFLKQLKLLSSESRFYKQISGEIDAIDKLLTKRNLQLEVLNVTG